MRFVQKAVISIMVVRKCTYFQGSNAARIMKIFILVAAICKSYSKNG